MNIKMYLELYMHITNFSAHNVQTVSVANAGFLITRHDTATFFVWKEEVKDEKQLGSRFFLFFTKD